MSKKVKEIVEKIIVLFSPFFALIMHSISGIGLYKQASKGIIMIEPHGTNFSSFELLKSDLNVVAKIIILLSLIGIILAIGFYIAGVILRHKENLFNKIGSISLVGACGILFLCSLFKTHTTYLNNNVTIYKWADYLTLLYGIVIVYSIIVLIYVINKGKKSNKINDVG